MKSPIATIAALGLGLVLVSCAAGRGTRPGGSVPIGGEVAPGFEAVRAEFERNFAERGELGSACAAYYQGKKVVDLWGGYRDARTRDPWQQDTLVLMFSATKGLSAMVAAVAHSHGWLNYDERVATYWPEFAQNGKGEITVRQLLDHQAGLILLDAPLPVATVADLDATAALLARQKPSWQPGTRHGYHLSTLGLYLQEIIRRVDPKHRSLGRFFQDEIARPLDIEFYIGLPASVPDARIATIEMLSPMKGLLNMDKLPWSMLVRLMNPNSAFNRSCAIPQGYDPNERLSRSIELGSGNGIGQVRAMAKAYGVFATGGRELDVSAATMADLTALPPVPKEGPQDELTGVEAYFSLGFKRPGPQGGFGSSRKAFGMPGSGGTLAFADPDLGLGYAYSTNRMGYYMDDDPREKSLRDALYRCIRQEAAAGRPASR